MATCYARLNGRFGHEHTFTGLQQGSAKNSDTQLFWLEGNFGTFLHELAKRMNLHLAMQAWIEHCWQEMGREFGAEDVPVGQYENFDTDDLSFPFKNLPIDSWRLISGKLTLAGAAEISRVPYVAFCLDGPSSAAKVQVQWAPRCGYGWDLTFDPTGEAIKQEMRWVS